MKFNSQTQSGKLFIPTQAQNSRLLLPDILRETARRFVTNGVIFNEKTIPYSEIDLASDRVASHLAEKGIRAADRVAVILRNSPEFIIACFAIWKVRGIVVPINPQTRTRSLLYIMQEVQPTALILDKSGPVESGVLISALPALKAVLVDHPSPGPCDMRTESLTSVCLESRTAGPPLVTGAVPGEVVSITYTSGSTGSPKGVMHTHASWLASAIFTRDHVGIRADDTMVIPLPLHHTYAFRQVLAYTLAGGTLIIVADLYEAFKVLRRLPVTALLLVPAACNIALDHFASIFRESGRTLRYVEIGAGAAAPELLRQLQRLLPKAAIHLPYGLTEARVAFLDVGPDGQPNRIGTVAPGLALKVLDSGGKPITKSHVGEIALRGTGLMAGYWRCDSRAQNGHEEWFRTGDLARVDDHGKLSLVGRVDDLLKIGGRKVVPQEVESALNRHSAVLRSAVVGRVDEERIMELKLHAYVVLRHGAKVTDEELLLHCRSLLESYKVPSKVHFCGSLPVSSLGKLQRHSLSTNHPSLAGNSVQGG